MNPEDYGYANLLQQSFQEHQSDVDNATLDLEKEQGGLKDRAIKAGEEISAAVFMKEGVSNTLKYAGSKLEQMGLKGMSKAVSDFNEGGLQKVIQGGISRGLQGGQQATQTDIEMNDMSSVKVPAEEDFVDEGDVADELPEGVIQMDPIGELADTGAEVGDVGAEIASTVPLGAANRIVLPQSVFDSGALQATEEADAVQQTFTSSAETTAEDVTETAGEDLAETAGEDIATSAATSLGSAVTGEVATDVVATGLEATGLALDATGIGAVVGVALGIGGVLASIFAPSSSADENIPPPPNVSYTVGA